MCFFSCLDVTYTIFLSRTRSECVSCALDAPVVIWLLPLSLSRCWEMAALVELLSAWASGPPGTGRASSDPGHLACTSLLFQPLQSRGWTAHFFLMMGIGKNTTSKSMEAGSSTEGKYEDEAKHPAFFTLPVTLPFSLSPWLTLQLFPYWINIGLAVILPFSVEVKAFKNWRLCTWDGLWEPSWLTVALAVLCVGVTWLD